MNVPARHPLSKTEEEIRAQDQRAREDWANGRTIPHEEVMRWVKSWGTPDERPAPSEWFK